MISCTSSTGKGNGARGREQTGAILLRLTSLIVSDMRTTEIWSAGAHRRSQLYNTRVRWLGLRYGVARHGPLLYWRSYGEKAAPLRSVNASLYHLVMTYTMHEQMNVPSRPRRA